MNKTCIWSWTANSPFLRDTYASSLSKVLMFVIISCFTFIFLNACISFAVFIYLLHLFSLILLFNSQGKPEISRHCRPTCCSIQYNLLLDFHILVFHMSLTPYVHLNPLCLIINCWLIENYIHRHLVSVITQQEPST